MKKAPKSSMLVIAAICGLSTSCANRVPTQVCPVPTEMETVDFLGHGDFDGVDILFVVDNSSSMKDESEIISTSFFQLVNALVNPLPGWGFPAVDDLRVAVVTSDMGLSWGGQPYESGDGAPSELTKECSAEGDNGRFKTLTESGAVKSVEIANNTIPCNSEKQCPPGWTCSSFSSPEIGVCLAPTDGEGSVVCPEIKATWLQTPSPGSGVDDSELNIEASCLAVQGTAGCDLEQPLMSAAKAITRPDQASFVRWNALLAVIVISDESDCSIIDGPALFATEEMQEISASKTELACERHTEFLYPTSDFHELLNLAKGRDNAVVFGAVVGVPSGDDSPCEGTGDTLGNCLEHDSMRLVQQESEPNIWSWTPACTRTDSKTGELLASASPGRRYVDLAERFGAMSYVQSICGDDWSSVLREISMFAAPPLCNVCLERPLEWDFETRKSRCDLMIEYRDGEECPAGYDGSILEEQKTSSAETAKVLQCALHKLAAPIDCAELNESDYENSFGWAYCENLSAENFTAACEDFIDNDGDGFVDCEDLECSTCTVCGGSRNCSGTSKYSIVLTPSARDEVERHWWSLRCPKHFSSDDANCQENTFKTCSDGMDNDGNGMLDCNGAPDSDKGEALSTADPSCCPMVKVGYDCVLVESTGNKPGARDICPIDGDEYPKACRANANRYECRLPKL